VDPIDLTSRQSHVTVAPRGLAACQLSCVAPHSDEIDRKVRKILYEQVSCASVAKDGVKDYLLAMFRVFTNGCMHGTA